MTILTRSSPDCNIWLPVSVLFKKGSILADGIEGLFPLRALGCEYEKYWVFVSSQVCLCRCSHYSCIVFFETFFKDNPTKISAEFRNTGRKYIRMQPGKMEANKSVLHLDFIKKGPFFFFSFNTIFSGCILIPDAFQGIWAFCKSWAFQSSCLWHRNKIGYINLSWKTRNLSGNTNSSGQMSCHLEDVLPTVLSGLED